MELHLVLNSRKLKMTSLALALSATLVTTSHAEVIYYDGSNPDDVSSYVQEFPKWDQAGLGYKLKSIYPTSGDNTSGDNTSGDNNILDIKNVNSGVADPKDYVTNIFGGLARSQTVLEGNTPRHMPVDVSNNRINLDKVDDYSVYGGWAVSRSTGMNAIYPANTNEATANENKIFIEGNVSGGEDSDIKVIGGYVHGNQALGKNNMRFETSSNRIEVEGNVLNASVIGGTGHSTNIANENIVIIKGNATGKGQLAGGYVVSNNQNVSASRNSVTVEGSAVRDNIYGGYADGNNSSHGSAVNNNEVIVRGDLIGNVAGGYSNTRSSGETSVTVDRNKVTLNGNVQGNIYGAQVSKGSDNISATHNVININAGRNIGSRETNIYGAAFINRSAHSSEINKDLFTKNTLNISSRSLTANTIANFEFFNFVLYPELANQDIASIDAKEIVLGNGMAGVSKIEVVGIKGGAPLYVNDKFILMRADQLKGRGEGVDSEVTRLQQGISVIYDVKTTIDQDKGKVLATILGGDKEEGFTPTKPAGRINPQLKALSEGNLANLMLVSRGADIAAYTAFDTIKTQNEGGLNTFILMEGGHNRYSSGSHIKSNDFHLMTGVSLRQDDITAAAFVEAGWGDYDTRNSFDNAANVDGDGKSRYVGVGVLGKYDFSNGMYVDGSLRFGKSHNKFNASDIKNATTGETARYSFNRNYVSAHAGVGYIHNIDAKNELDFSAKYLWAHLGSKDTVIAGDSIKFDSLDSNRLRLTATWNHQYTESTKFKAGVGYEYEFSAKAKATALNTYSIDAPSVKGSTGILTLGMSINPESNKRLGIDFNINGYAGKRDGVSANIKVDYQF